MSFIQDYFVKLKKEDAKQTNKQKDAYSMVQTARLMVFLNQNEAI